MKDKEPTGFGERLANIRKAKGLTQVELADAIGSTQRNISYYESDQGYAPAPVIVALAHALAVSTDELLGVARAKPKAKHETQDPQQKRLLKKLSRVLELPPAERKAVLKVLDNVIDGYKARSSRRSA